MDGYLGLDFGTSGARAIVVDPQGAVLFEAHQAFMRPDDPELWQKVLFNFLDQVPIKPQALAIAGTSGTVLLCDRQGDPVHAPLMYNDDRAQALVQDLARYAPVGHGVLSATSSLAKALWFRDQPCFTQGRYLLHQADWLAGLLHRTWGVSDHHNALKLGFDPQTGTYPAWLTQQWPDLAALLPRVYVPGTPVGQVQGQRTLVCAGTTDSTAALIASGATQPGTGVTSLGSTLVLKILSHRRIEAAPYGIYSHRLGDLWLAGGASNTGGAVLRKFFTDQELMTLSTQIDPEVPSLLDYYPLLKAGERFPLNDPHYAPRFDPPAEPVAFLQGLLEGMARIEAQGYGLLAKLGAPPLTHVRTCGGGAPNPTWTRIRERHLGVPVIRALHQEAAYGAACLALRGHAKLLIP